MHFHKYPYPANFEFTAISPDRPITTGRGRYKLNLKSCVGDIYHLQITGQGWAINESGAGLKSPRKASGQSETQLTFAKDGSLHLVDKQGKTLLRSLPGRTFGQCGEASVFEFVRHANDQFYGLGEKWSGFEHSGKTTKFWNTDVWGDFNPDAYIHGRPAPDPAYVSIPYLIIKRGNSYLGLLMDNPGATFISTGFKTSIANQMEVAPGGEIFAETIIEATEESPSEEAGHPQGLIHLGAETGQPNLYLIYGPSLPELTRKLQNLIGTTPMPPAWALGYHQCRWGYESEADLLELDANFREHGIPVDGLWLDIDYMDGYRVFTFAQKHFPKPAAAMKKLAKAGRKVIPIIDPGVKFEPGYGVYDRGHKANAFCLNSQKKEYVGLVWPGETVFPDFSETSARKWWAGEVQKFAETGIQAAWLDMNDPSTGPSDNSEMLFAKGRKPHSFYHNQYALGMAIATREGFLQTWPNERPFLLCRSGFTGSNRYTAIWTGDNYSNYHHLKNSIATTLNLALSGLPFNGPDAGGFGGDTTPELIRDWFKAGFLFPVLRNHSLINTRRQEPWAFDKKTVGVLRHYIQLRYRLRPYLYQLFAEHERTGEAILRPLFYDFADKRDLPLGLVDDQFLVGPSILQAPFVEEGQSSREVVLPGEQPWFDLTTGRWIDGGKKVTVNASFTDTPLYIRDRSILPLARLSPEDHVFSAAKADFHIFLSTDSTAETSYVFDDGKSFAYAAGERSEVALHVTRKGTSIEIVIAELADGFGPGEFTFTTPPAIKSVLINGRTAEKTATQGIPFGSSKATTWI